MLASELVVFPTERHVERSIDRTVTSSRRFFGRVRERVAPDDRPASRALLTMLAKRALDEIGARASVGGGLGLRAGAPRRAAERSGLAAAADATIAALIQSGATEQDVELTGTPRAPLLAQLMRSLRAGLAAAGRSDPRELLPASAHAGLDAALEELPDTLRVEGTVALDGAHTDAWLRIHHAIRKHGGRGVQLSLPRFGADGPMTRVAEALERRLADEPDGFDLDWFEPRRAERVAVLECHGVEAEARAVTRRVAEALARGCRPDRIALVVPGRDETFLEPLRNALHDAGIAFSEAGGAPAERAPEARTLLALLEMAAGRLDKGALIELLRSPGLHPGSLVAERDEELAVVRAARLAARLRGLPVLQDREGQLFVEVLKAALDQDRGDDDFWMVAALERLCGAITGLRAAACGDELVSNLLALVDRMRLGDPSAREIAHALGVRTEGGARARALRAIGEGAVAVRAIREALEEIREAGRLLETASQPWDLGELVADLGHQLGGLATAARGAAGRAGAIRVGDVREVLGLPHDLVVLTRMSGRSYAAALPATLLDERTRRALPPARRPLSLRERTIAREAQLEWSLSCASEIALSFSATDEAGREAEPPHPRVSQALAAGAERRSEPASRVMSSASLLTARAQELAALAAGAPPASDLIARVAVETDRNRFFVDAQARPGPFTGSIDARSRELLRARIGGGEAEHAVSVSFVERAAVCSFRAFADRVLRARRSDDIVDALSPREHGELLHRALFAAFDSERALPPSAGEAARIEAARIAIDTALELRSPASTLRREGRLRVARDALTIFGDEIQGERTFFYREGERKFGPREPPPWGALDVVSAEGETVWVEGRIDRIDASADRTAFRVVDYKTGRPKSRRARDDDFQVPLYAIVARRLEGQRTYGVYIAVAPGGATTVTPSKEAEQLFSDERLAEVARSAARGVVRLWSGNVAPRPAQLSACKRCDARDLCRRPVVVPESQDEDAAPESPT